MFNAVLNFLLAIFYTVMAVLGWKDVGTVYVCACIYVALACTADGLIYLQRWRKT
jgi:hypothetical protein